MASVINLKMLTVWKNSEEDYLEEGNSILSAQVTMHRQITCRKDMKCIPALGKSLTRAQHSLGTRVK